MADFTADYLSERLFHFWRHDPPDRGFSVFRSVVERGLLLSRGTKALVDSFRFRRRDGAVDTIEIVQNARVCFTDVPEDKLSPIFGRYGRCGIGFSRRQVMEWGGLPVWYLPNHYRPGTVMDSAGAFLSWLGEAVTLIGLLPALLKQTGSSLTLNGQPMSQEEAEWRAESIKQSILRVGSHLKEMSSKDQDDHQYLYEREWRIVGGCVSDEFGSVCRRLAEAEKGELLAARPDWGEALEANRPEVTRQLSGERLIDSFWYFNGIPGAATVAQAMEVVIVPDDHMKGAVEEYIAANPERFRVRGPEVRLAAR